MHNLFDKVIVTLTTIPTRAAYLHRTIESIKSQTRKPDSVELNIPVEYRKRELGKVDYSLLPKEVSIHNCEDFGPATKLLPTLSRYAGKNVCIIYCDDDRVYDKNWIARLLHVHEQQPVSCIADEVLEVRNRYFANKYRKNICYRLRRLASAGLWKPSKNDPYCGQIAEGFGGVLIRPNFFCEKTFKIDEEFSMVDDIWLSAMLAKNNVLVKFSGRKDDEKSKAVMVENQDLGRIEGSLVKSGHQGFDRLNLDWRAIKLANERYGVWDDALKDINADR